MKKAYILDTNILIQYPCALYCFDDNEVILPLIVLEELDRLKKSEGERGANARESIREIEKLRQKGDLLSGVALPSGGSIRVEKNCVDVALPESLATSSPDNRILKICKAFHQDGQSSILVTKDIVLRLKAELLGIRAEDFETQQVVHKDKQYTGRMTCYVREDRFDQFKQGGLSTQDLYQTDESGKPTAVELVNNQFIILKADQSIKKTQLARIQGDSVVPLTFINSKPYGVSPRNAGQFFLQEALMLPSEEAPLVIVKGMAGTAKTFYSLAVGLEKLVNNPQGEYRRILICRPNAQFDSDIGFLPGDEQDKISPLLRPILDNLEILIDSDDSERYQNEAQLRDKLEELFDRGIIQAEALNYIRGRSIIKTYLIIDEAQNMTPNQVKGIITRAGQGTKIILLGDPNQIDKPFLDERTNGLSYASEHMKGSGLCYQLTLTSDECERSVLAMDAIRRL